MIKEIELDGKKIEYYFLHKKVKNINIRIKPDMTVHVSASRFVSQREVENFLIEKSDFILRAIEKFSEKEVEPLVCYRSEDELKNLILLLCHKAYPYYEKKLRAFPVIRFRKMVSRWGSCHPVKKIITFNTNLIYAPEECVKYVVWHEFTHFIYANHSKYFYDELIKVCPDWKRCRQMLKKIYIR